MKKPSKVLSMVLAVMMVMSSFAGLTGLNAKAAAYTPSSGTGTTTVKLLEPTMGIAVVDEKGDYVCNVNTDDAIGKAPDYKFYIIDEDGKEATVSSGSSVDSNKMAYLRFTKSASTSAFTIKEIRVCLTNSQAGTHQELDTLSEPISVDKIGYEGDEQYTYSFPIYDDLSGNTSDYIYDFYFVVTAKTLDFDTALDSSFDGKAEVGLVDENSKLEYGKDFEFTITPAAGYAFNDLANNKLEVSLYDENGKVVLDSSKKAITFDELNITREGLYNFKIAAEGTSSPMTTYGVNDILDAFYGTKAAYLAVSNEFDTNTLDENIVKKGDFIEASVTKEVPGKGSVEVKGLTEGINTNEGKYFIKSGTEVVLTATPKTSYKLVGVTVIDSATPSASDLVEAEKAFVEVSKDGKTATVLFDADVNKFTTPIVIKPVFEQTATITVTNDSTNKGVTGSLSVNGKTVDTAKVNSTDENVELTLSLTKASKQAGKVLNPALKTTPLYALGSPSVAISSSNLIVLNYDRTDENGNFVFKLSFNNTAKTNFDTAIANDAKTIKFTNNQSNIFAAASGGTSNLAGSEFTDYAVNADSVKPYFLFSDIKALGANGTVEIKEYNENTGKYDGTDVTGTSLKVGETYQVKITPDPDVNQPLLNVTNYKTGEEVEDFTVNYKKDTKTGEYTDVVESYTFSFVAKYAIDDNFDLTKANYFTLTFGARQSKYVSIDITGEGSITLKDPSGKEYDIATLDTALGVQNSKTTVYIAPDEMDNLESLTVEKVTTDVTGATKKEPVEITPAGDAYKVTLEQDADVSATFVITAKFKEAAKSYPVINGTPYDKSEENGGYLSLTLPNLNKPEVYAGQEITVSAVPMEDYKLGVVTVFTGAEEPSEGSTMPNPSIVDMKQEENGSYTGTYTVPVNMPENGKVRFAATFVNKDEPDNPDKPDVPGTNGWKEDKKNGTWSYVDENNELLKGWHNDIKGWEGKWFYFDKNGVMVTDWHNDIPGWEGQWFYFDLKTGVMQTGWLTNIPGWEGKWFYFNPVTGVMKGDNDWLLYNGKWYFFNSDGTMVETGWSLDMNSGKWYYFGKDGAMLTKTWTPDGYYVGEDGAWIPGYQG